MCAEDNDLLPVCQQFDLLIGVAFGRDDIAGNFFKRRVGSEKYCALGRLSGADEYKAALLEPFARQCLDGIRGLRVR